MEAIVPLTVSQCWTSGMARKLKRVVSKLTIGACEE